MRCTATLTLFDPAALNSRTPRSEAAKAVIQCTLPGEHQSNHAAMIDDTDPKGAILLWPNSTTRTP